MDAKNIFLFVIAILLIWMVFKYISDDVSSLTGTVSAKTMQQISAGDLTASGNSTSNFAYSIWFYVDDWNYRYGESKIVFGRMAPSLGDREPCPVVAFTPSLNNMVISQAVYPGLDKVDTSASAGINADSKSAIVHSTTISNIPLQRWVNLIVSIYNRTMDIYLDGKLVKTDVLPGVAKVDANAPVYITPNGGFSGWTAKFQYWSDAVNPQQAWDVYYKGYGGSWLANMFGRYYIQVTLMDGDSPQTTVTI